MIVCVNRIDEKLLTLDKKDLNKLKKKHVISLKKLDTIQLFIPISGWCGDNMTEKVKILSLKGPTLLEALDTI